MTLAFSFIFFLEGAALPGLSNGSRVGWGVLETKRFKIVYHDGVEEAAHRALSIAEATYGRISTYLQVDAPTKITVILIGYDDVSYGFSWQGLAAARGSLERSATIWHILLSAGESDSDHPEMGDDGGGLTPEVNASQSRVVVWLPPSTKLTSANYSWIEKTVAYGVGRVLIYHKLSLAPVALIAIAELEALGAAPIWFTEGMALYLAQAWDSYSDSILRAAALGNRLLPYKRLVAGFYGLSFEERLLFYVQAYSLASYLADNFGEEVLSRLLVEKKKSIFGFDEVLHRTIGLNGDELYRDWRKSLIVAYGVQTFQREDMEGAAERLTAIGGFRAHPSFSPDGRSIAFASSSDNDFAVGSLWVITDRGREAVRLVKGINFDPAWSPDGGRIAYSKTDLHEGLLVSDIYSIKSDGGGEIRLTHGARASQPAWSPDGRALVFARNINGRSEIFSMNDEGGDLVQLTHSDVPSQNYSPVWSPDGKKIAFSAFRAGKRDIVTIDSDGRNPFFLTDDDPDDRVPLWSANGEKILFLSDRDGDGYALYSIPSRGGHPENIIPATGAVSAIDLSPDEERLVFSTYGYDGFHVYVMNLDLGELKEEPNPLALTSLEENPSLEESFSSNPSGLLLTNEGEVSSSAYDALGGLERPFFLPYGYYFGERLFRIGILSSFGDLLAHHLLELKADYNRVEPGLILQGGYTNKVLSTPVGLLGRYRRIDSSPRAQTWSSESLAGELSLGLNLGRFNSVEGNVLVEKLNVNRSRAAALLDEGLVNTLGFKWAYSQMMPTADNALNPSGGNNLEIKVEWADELIYSDFTFTGLRLDYRGYLNLDRIAPYSVLALHLVGGIREGNSPYQGLFLLKSALPLVEDSANILSIRGGSQTQEVGDRVGFISGEYRFPIFRDMGLTLLDFLSPWSLYFEGMYGALFFDSGKAWHGELDLGREPLKSGLGVEVRQRLLGLGGGVVLRLGIAGEPSFISVFRPYVSIGGVF